MVLFWLIKGCFINACLLYIKMSEYKSVESADLTYYPRNRDAILNRAKDYCKNDKDRLMGQVRDKHRKLYEGERNNKKSTGRIDITICLKKKNQRLKEYQKSYRKAKKSQYNNE